MTSNDDEPLSFTFTAGSAALGGDQSLVDLEVISSYATDRTITTYTMNADLPFLVRISSDLAAYSVIGGLLEITNRTHEFKIDGTVTPSRGDEIAAVAHLQGLGLTLE